MACNEVSSEAINIFIIKKFHSLSYSKEPLCEILFT